MFINKLNQLYKPRRILYYTDVDDAVTADFRNGKNGECEICRR